MNYELCKLLKEAGFPQHELGTFFTNIRRGNPPEDKERFYSPTLSELIKACGDSFIHLARLRNSKWECVPCDDFGSTPEEAVALLYLALHNKNNGN